MESEFNLISGSEGSMGFILHILFKSLKLSNMPVGTIRKALLLNAFFENDIPNWKEGTVWDRIQILFAKKEHQNWI